MTLTPEQTALGYKLDKNGKLRDSKGHFASSMRSISAQQAKEETHDFIQSINAIDEQACAAMRTRINSSFAAREQFETKMNPESETKADLINAKQKWASRAVERVFTALNIDPDMLVNIQRKANQRANLKALRKISGVCEFLLNGSKLEKVVISFFVSTLIAHRNGIDWISNQDQYAILSSAKLNRFPQFVQDAVTDYQHKFMTEGKFTQASQMRTAFENVGIYQIVTRYDNNNNAMSGITLKDSHPLLIALADKLGVPSAMQIA
jgi:hypothetical protein